MLIIEPSNVRHLMIPEQQRLLETFLVLIAGAVERLELTLHEQSSRLAEEREELRIAVGGAVPRFAHAAYGIVRQAEILMLNLSSEGSRYIHQAGELRQQTLSTIRLVNNILDMARIEADGFRAQTDWIALEEVIGSALKSLESILSPRQVRLDLPHEMILLQADGPLLERVFVNLLENAHKYAGPEAEIGIQVEKHADSLKISVWDTGPGLPAGKEK